MPRLLMDTADMLDVQMPVMSLLRAQLTTLAKRVFGSRDWMGLRSDRAV